MDECKIRPPEFVGQKPVDTECVCKNDSIYFAVVKSKCWSRLRGIRPYIRSFDCVVVLSRENVGSCSTVDILVLTVIIEFRDNFRRYRDIASSEQILERIRPSSRIIRFISTRNGELLGARVGNNRP